MDRKTAESHRVRYSDCLVQAQNIHQLGQEILSWGIPDLLTTRSLEPQRKVLDSSWLYVSLHSFFCIKKWGKCAGYHSMNETVAEISPPLDLEQLSRFFYVDKNIRSVFSIQTSKISSQLVIPSLVDPGIRRVRRRKYLRRAILYFAASIQSRIFSKKIAAFGLYNLKKNFLFSSLRSVITLDEPVKLYEAKLDRLLRTQFASLLFERLNRCGSAFGLSGSDIQALSVILSFSIPISHLEGRRKNFEEARKISRKIKASIVLQVNGLFYSTSDVFLAAAYKTSGAKLVGMQHGGFYGYSRIHSLPASLEGFLCDLFITWGWNKWPNDVTTPPSPLLPSGSLYLRCLQQKSRRQSRKAKKVLFCAADYYPIPYRMEIPCDSIFAENQFWPANASALCAFIQKQQLSLTCKFYDGTAVSRYQSIISEIFSHEGVEITVLETAKAALSFFHEYEIVVWDTVGTGFFESVTCGIHTFLLPSARWLPELLDGITLSEWFFVDHAPNANVSFQRRFEIAMSESKAFFENYGKTLEVDLNDLLNHISGYWNEN